MAVPSTLMFVNKSHVFKGSSFLSREQYANDPAWKMAAMLEMGEPKEMKWDLDSQSLILILGHNKPLHINTTACNDHMTPTLCNSLLKFRN